MTGHRIHPGGSDEPKFLVTTVHADGVVCHHTGATISELNAFVDEHATEDDVTTFWTIAPGRIDGIHWVLVA